MADTTRNPLYHAFSAGIQARKQELAMTANPYNTDTAAQRAQRDAWLRGWETEDRFIRRQWRDTNPEGK